ncbi:MAG: PPC domain-containing DNA-binding protein [Anaerolineales bacterium]
MEYRKFGENYMLRLEIGEEIITQLKEFCVAHEIGSGKVTGIGVVRRAKLSYFDVELGDYKHREISEYLEMTSLMGNISLMEGEPFPHLHVTLADSKFNSIGGHFSEGEIGVTGELIIEPFEQAIERKYYQETGFRLLALED